MKHILKIYYLRNVFIVSILIAIGLIVCNFYFIFPSFNELLIKDIETEAVHLTRHISSMITTDLTALSRDSISAEMLKAINQLKEEFEFLKLNIFSRSGVTIFSTESEMIGTINKNDYFHRILSKGQTFSQVAVISARSLEIEVLSVDVVETYVPIIKDAQVIGVFEIYYDITNRKAALDRLVSIAQLVVLILVLGLLGITIIVLSKASKNVYHQELAQKEIMYRQKIQVVLEMAGAVCHEMNQPLMSVLGYCELIQMNMSKDNPLFNKLTKIREEIDRMGEITKKLMGITKYESKEYISGKKIIDIEKSSL
jgi:signal transduction histidine kinase